MSSGSLTPAIITRVCREIRALNDNPPDGVRFYEEGGDSISEVNAVIFGPGINLLACCLVPYFV